ncbi:GYDIA family GHMP kinase [Wenyingzhuangia sp. 2_MG-2023]|uniref:GYDIA family GHMP kinase n=1 Tax=Wenyingzhuangia sp. 2_MG-2023 TaxID=3062639 RepID=UPI0026E3A36C|nr:GYDIA family GHMP kinase [Wenyingzhuangia sp. 2_MG-2023]MDO6738241.1 GYDIA family GHMP kinase [Wenyingzhuangia sp. 2_MG-2023]
MEQFYSNGKLLVSGEYLVLDGAVSLALPTKYGQSLEVQSTNSNQLIWKSFNVLNECWFQATFDLETFLILNHTSIDLNSEKIAKTLQEILRTAKILNPDFLRNSNGLQVVTQLSFPNKWGLGTSSTLINNVAQWAKINAFELLEKSFGGSGYDIACAQNKFPITYKRNGIAPMVEKVRFNPVFKDQLFFVYLNHKQDSKEGIQMYRSLSVDKKELITKVDKITQKLLTTQNIEDFELLLNEHEKLIGELLQLIPVKEKLFSDYTGAIKSLGAWGGDFVLVTGQKLYVESYFTNKGFDTIVLYTDMILT